MNIKYKDLEKWQGKQRATTIYEDYKNGKIKTMLDLLQYYGIG